MKRVMLAIMGLAALLVPARGIAQQPIKVGYPMILSGPGALFGEPALKGAQMFVDEIAGHCEHSRLAESRVSYSRMVSGLERAIMAYQSRRGG